MLSPAKMITYEYILKENKLNFPAKFETPLVASGKFITIYMGEKKWSKPH